MGTEVGGPISHGFSMDVGTPLSPSSPNSAVHDGMKVTEGMEEKPLPPEVFANNTADAESLQGRVSLESPERAEVGKLAFGRLMRTDSVDSGYSSPSETSRPGSPSVEKKVGQVAKATLHQVEFQGETLKIKEVVKLGEGATGVAHAVVAVKSKGQELLATISESVVLKKIKESLPEEKIAKAEASLKAGYETHLRLRGGEPFLELRGIQSTPHLVKITTPDGVRFGQLGKAYSGTMDSLIAYELEPEELTERSSEVYGLFADIVEGHQTLLKHDIFQNDYTMNNYYLDDQGNACIGDLDSCYQFTPDANGKLSEKLTLPTGLTAYSDFKAYTEKIEAFNQGADNLGEIKELAQDMLVFSLGCNLFESLYGSFPFDFANPDGDYEVGDPLRHPIIEKEPLENCDPFIAKMLHPDPSQRPTLEEVQQVFEKRAQI